MKRRPVIASIGWAALLAGSGALAQEEETGERPTREERREIREAQREALQNLPEEERAAAREKLREAYRAEREEMRQKWESMTPEERTEMRQQRREAMAARRAEMRERRENMTEEERQAMREKREQQGGRHKPGKGKRGRPGGKRQTGS